MSPLLTPPWGPIGRADGADFQAVLDAVDWEGLWWAGAQSEGEGQAVVTFVDQTTNGNDWTDGVPGQIVFRGSGLNNQPALEFDGVARYTGGVASLTQDWAWMILCEASTLDGSYLGTNLNNPAIRRTATVDFEWRGNGGAFIRTVEASAAAGAHLVMGESDGSEGRTRIWFDGTLIINETGDADYTGFSINALGGISGAEIQGMFASAGVVFNTLWSTASTARQTVEAWAADVYAVPIP